MQIVIIGTGNTATVIGKKLKAAGHTIKQVYGRNPDAAKALAALLDAGYCSVWDAVVQDAGLYIIAISDKAVSGNEIQLRLHDQLVVHTAGSVSMDVLKTISKNYGVLYPYQTIRKETEPLPEIPFFIDANTATGKEKLLTLAKTISDKVSEANDAERMKYHVCAIVANNFSNYLYTLTEDYCRKNGLAFNNLLPLIDETASRLHRFSPREVQTGPAIRRDMVSIEQHLNLLQHEPALKKLYESFSDGIMKYRW